MAEEVLIGSARQADWVQARRQFVYLPREWVNMTTLELGKRLKWDPSRVARTLYSKTGS